MSKYATAKKTVYFATRTMPSLEDWHFRWRQHCSLAMTRPFWMMLVKYSQCDVIHDDPFNTGEKIDGVGVSWQTPGNASGVLGMYSDPEGVRMILEDEKGVFDEYVGDISVITEETVLRESNDAPIKLFVRLNRKSAKLDDVLVPFAEDILADEKLGKLVYRLSADLVVPDEYTKNSRFNYGAHLEVSVMNVDSASAFIKSDELRQIADRYFDAFDIDWRILVSKENMYWDPADNIDERDRIVREFPPIYN